MQQQPENSLRPPGTLNGVRVVDASENIAAPYAARLLGDLGAEVIKIEAPSGDPLRRRGPFPDPSHNINQSAMFHLINAGKRGCILDPASNDAAERLDLILSEADFIITSSGAAFDQLVWARDAELSDRHPRLIIGRVAATPPEWGPAATSECSLHAASLGGVSAIIGEPERPPLCPPYDVLEYLAGANLAAALIVSLFERERSGRGQRVEIVTSEMAAHYLMTPRINDLITGSSHYSRTGRRSPGAMGGIYPWGLYPCADGLVALVSHARRNWQTLLEMLGNPAWSRRPQLADPLEIARSCAAEVDKLLCQEMKRFTREELFRSATGNSFALGPVNTIADVLGSEHLVARKSLAYIAIGDREVLYVRRPFLLTETPISCKGAPAPNLVDNPFAGWRKSTYPTQLQHRWHGATEGSGPLVGMRVVDFSWNWAGPMVGAALADMGAQVIRVEHRGRLDNSRLRARPSVHGTPVEGPLEEVSYYFHQNNRGKLGVTFNIKDAQGVDLAAELIAKSDLVIENFTPGVFGRAGLDFETMRGKNPQLVWLSMTSAGHTGPLSGIRTYAPIMSALAGLESLVGYENEAPVGMLGYSFGDMNGGAHALVVALAALRHARVTGKGQFIDFSLIETQMSVLIEPMAEVALGAPVPGSQGTRHPFLCPHGNYRCAGTDAWLALSISDDKSWGRLLMLIDPDGSKLPHAQEATLGFRRAHASEIDAVITDWTCVRERDAAVQELQRNGIAATPVLSSDELVRAWPNARYVELPHPVTGPDRVLPVPWRMSGSRPQPRRPAPLVGEHTRFVLQTILDRTEEEADALLASAATL